MRGPRRGSDPAIRVLPQVAKFEQGGEQGSLSALGARPMLWFHRGSRATARWKAGADLGWHQGECAGLATGEGRSPLRDIRGVRCQIRLSYI